LAAIPQAIALAGGCPAQIDIGASPFQALGRDIDRIGQRRELRDTLRRGQGAEPVDFDARHRVEFGATDRVAADRGFQRRLQLRRVPPGTRLNLLHPQTRARAGLRELLQIQTLAAQQGGFAGGQGGKIGDARGGDDQRRPIQRPSRDEARAELPEFAQALIDRMQRGAGVGDGAILAHIRNGN
jgi:hypothetical protein